MTVTEPTSQEAGQLKSGRIVAIAGPVVDVEFPQHALPEINHAVEMDITLEGNTVVVTLAAPLSVEVPDGLRRCRRAA